MTEKGLKTARIDKRGAAVAAAVIISASCALTWLGLQADSGASGVRTEETEIQVVAESVEPVLIAPLMVETPALPNEMVPLDHSIQESLVFWCNLYGVPVEVALGCIETESGFLATAQNGRCYGYMQINGINRDWLSREIGISDLTDPAQNIHSGVYILGDLFAKYGDWHKALVYYNCGEAGAQRDVFSTGRVATAYSEKVLARAENWREVIY